MTRLFLDTHVLIWWANSDGTLPARMRRALRDVRPDNPALVSDISLWEIAILVRHARIRLHLPLRDWLERATAAPLVQRVGISPPIVAELLSLPKSFPGDPADQLIAASARVIGATLLTCDKRIRESNAVPTY